MRHIYTLLIVLIFVSCSKDDQMVSRDAPPSTSATQVVSAAVASGAEYQLPVTAGNTRIHKQPANFAVSVINVDEKTGMTVYRYMPPKGFSGNDEVTLSESKTHMGYGSGGCNYGDGEPTMVTTTTFVKIRFTVSE